MSVANTVGCSTQKSNQSVRVLPTLMVSEMRNQILKVQQDPNFQNKIHPMQIKNPEYWNPDYVLITNLKAYLTNLVIKNNMVTNDMVAWIDFGYCRDSESIPSSKKWEYSFNPEKIHMFNYKDYHSDIPIEDVIATNDVYILGAKVVAHKNLWAEMAELMQLSYQRLQKCNMVDDDQGLWLMSYILKPELFELHKILDPQYGHNPFVLFHEFNDKA